MKKDAANVVTCVVRRKNSAKYSVSRSMFLLRRLCGQGAGCCSVKFATLHALRISSQTGINVVSNEIHISTYYSMSSRQACKWDMLHLGTGQRRCVQNTADAVPAENFVDLRVEVERQSHCLLFPRTTHKLQRTWILLCVTINSFFLGRETSSHVGVMDAHSPQTIPHIHVYAPPACLRPRMPFCKERDLLLLPS